VICLVCRQADIVAGLTSVHFERGEMRLVVSNVPAQICPSCGEAYVNEAVAVWLLEAAEDISEEGILEASVDYSVKQTS
jgi:YgiT-type zinc finger domain-containing protein